MKPWVEILLPVPRMYSTAVIGWTFNKVLGNHNRLLVRCDFKRAKNGKRKLLSLSKVFTINQQRRDARGN